MDKHIQLVIFVKPLDKHGSTLVRVTCPPSYTPKVKLKSPDFKVIKLKTTRVIVFFQMLNKSKSNLFGTSGAVNIPCSINKMDDSEYLVN